jgi:hypothetical protein
MTLCPLYNKAYIKLNGTIKNDDLETTRKKIALLYFKDGYPWKS